MDTLVVPAAVREKLGYAGSDGLVKMFADAHSIAVQSFEQRLSEEMAKTRLEIADLKFDLLKWNFLFWIAQLAAVTGILSVMLRGA